ncbi:MAG: uroporphyrinogen-III synthase [Gammaproteobacteria bacterium]|nr:uroporphyrinogen-III synthase [Gammaproteobacteria bacterium]
MTAAADSDLQSALRGRGIVVTRPAHQAEALCQLLEAAGACALRFPVIEIQPAKNPSALQVQLQRLSAYDTAIFISANAVEQTFALLPPQNWPAQVKIAAVGSATARRLEEHGLVVTSCPASGFSSEALLALPEFQQLQGRRILILRGEGGREQLRDALVARGAQVDYLELYRRVTASSDPAPLLTQWQAGAIDAVLLTSAEGLRSLQAIIGTLGMQLLRSTCMVVAHARIRDLAKSLGHSGAVVVAADATDAAMLEALRQHFS